MNLARLLMIDLSGPRLTPDERAFLSERQPGGVCLFGRNVIDRFQLAALLDDLRDAAGDDVLVAVDQEGGGVVRVLDLPFPPSAMALGAADDVELTRAVAEATGHGLRSLGIDLDLAPVADVNSNPANPVIADRAFGSDPQHVARHVAAFVRGLQGAGVAATAKHFPGHGDVAIDSHLALPTSHRTVEELERLEWPPFRAAMQAGVKAVMTAHVVLSRVDAERPATLSRAVITGLLRERLGYQGAVLSDALEMNAVAARWDGAEATVLALQAGVDMPARVASLAEHAAAIDAVERAAVEGRLDAAALAASVARLDVLRRTAPHRAEPGAAWREGDAALLDEASRRALVSVGALPRLAAGARIVLVAAEATRQSAATQATVSPAASLTGALRERGVHVVEVRYRRDDAGDVRSVATPGARSTTRDAPLHEAPPAHPSGAPRGSLADALDRAREASASADLVVFASTARTFLSEGEKRLGRELARLPRSFLHLALWNPYAVQDLPGPALVTFGWRERSLRAAADALVGEAPVTGTPPVPLRTAAHS